MLTVAVKQYLAKLASRLRRTLGSEVLAVYLTGSGALGDWNADTSDIDILAISASRLASEQKSQVVAALSHPALPCPARGLELVIYCRDAVAAPGPRLEFELNLNTGPGFDQHVSFDAREEPEHWFVIDLAIARRQAIPLIGPRPEMLIGAIDERQLRGALIESLRWHDVHEPASANSVLNACRAWRYVAEHTWSSKTEAARWALQRQADPVLLSAALESRVRRPGRLDTQSYRAFLEHVATMLACC